MGFYTTHIFPRIMDFALGREDKTTLRKKLLEGVEGAILEIGFGTGLNLPCYPESVTKIAAIEPNEGMRGIARRRIDKTGVDVTYLPLEDGRIAVDDRSFDCVVSSWTLCSIENVERAMTEVRRTLKRGGRFLFFEHGLSGDPKIRKKQRRWNPVTKRLLGGCNISRNIPELVESGNLKIQTLDRFTIDADFAIFSSMFQGVAVKQ